MEIINNDLNLTEKNYLEIIEDFQPADLYRTAFFDIETTGLSREYSMLYLAGFVYFEDNKWKYRQFLAENEEDEFRTLLAMREFMKNFDLLISFNGESFDLPFILARYDKYAINALLPKSFDIYRAVKPFKSLLGLENMKQKSIERFLSVDREDKMNGGELIDVYWNYAKNHGKKERSLLLLHNADDIAGMPELLQIFLYLGIFIGTGYNYLSFSVNECINVSGEPGKELLIRIKLKNTVPHNKFLSNNGLSISFSGSEAMISVPIIEKELRLYFKDYKNYFYLPEEDTVIHKSVGNFMETSRKEKATASNCCIKKTAFYLPQFKNELFSPSFREDYKSKEKFFIYDENLMNEDKLKEYLMIILEELKKKPSTKRS
ncbi:ribonuclease H-like domain-containing protein [Lachnospiraceae bacterium C1.1]|nr:ribonuclease H-like domain-containing protein [Lachnospiraceae bacterium C1.1]